MATLLGPNILEQLRVEPRNISLINDATGTPITTLLRDVVGRAVLRQDRALEMLFGNFSKTVRLLCQFLPGILRATIAQAIEIEIQVADSKEMTKDTSLQLYGTRIPIAQKLVNNPTKIKGRALAEWIHRKRGADIVVSEIPGTRNQRRVYQVSNCAFRKAATLRIFVVDFVYNLSVLFPPPTENIMPLNIPTTENALAELLEQISTTADTSPAHYEHAVALLREFLSRIQ